MGCMADIELSSPRRVSASSYNQLPQQDCGTSRCSRPSTNKKGPKQSISTVRSNTRLPLSPELKALLPPKRYLQHSVRWRVWRHIFYASAFVTALGLPLAVFLPISFFTPASNISIAGRTLCSSLTMQRTQAWGLDSDVSLILNISVAYGNLSFGMAKFIDLVWDILISRGGQALLGWVTYRVHSAALMRIMESNPVSNDLYATMTLSWATLWGLGPLTRAFFTRLGFRVKLLLFWHALSVLWVVIWPTITNAMTGYVAKNDTLVKLRNGIGYAHYSDIASNENKAFQFEAVSSAWTGPLLLASGPNITLWNIMVDATVNIFLNDPYLNYTVPGLAQNSSDPYATVAYAYYHYNGQNYNLTDFWDDGNVECVATSKYQWGFSTYVLLIFIVLNSAWTVGTYGVWTHLNRKGELGRKGRTMGKYRAAVDMAEAIKAGLGDDICTYSNQELEIALKHGPGVRYAVTFKEGDGIGHIGLASGRSDDKLKLNFGQLYGRTSRQSLELDG